MRAGRKNAFSAFMWLDIKFATLQIYNKTNDVASDDSGVLILS